MYSPWQSKPCLLIDSWTARWKTDQVYANSSVNTSSPQLHSFRRSLLDHGSEVISRNWGLWMLSLYIRLIRSNSNKECCYWVYKPPNAPSCYSCYRSQSDTPPTWCLRLFHTDLSGKVLTHVNLSPLSLFNVEFPPFFAAAAFFCCASIYGAC